MGYDSQGRYTGDNAGLTGNSGFAQTVQGPTFTPIGGGGGDGTASDTMAQYNADQEQRYTQILSGYDQRVAQAAQFTGQAGLDIAEQYRGINSGIQQNLLSRGLQNTTIAPTMAMGVQREADAAQNRQRDILLDRSLGLQRERLDYMTHDQDRMVAPAISSYGGGLFGGGGGGGGGGDGGNFNPATANGVTAGAQYTMGGLTMPYRQPGTANYTGYAGHAGQSGITPRTSGIANQTTYGAPPDLSKKPKSYFQ